MWWRPEKEFAENSFYVWKMKVDLKCLYLKSTEIMWQGKKLKVEKGDILLDKDRYSAFFGTPLDLILKDRGVKTVMITGLASNVCCESTAREGFFLGYRVMFVDDLNVTLNDEMHRWAVENIRLVFGYVLSSDELIEKLQESS